MYLSLDEYGKTVVDNLIRSEATRCKNLETLVKDNNISVSVTMEP